MTEDIRIDDADPRLALLRERPLDPLLVQCAFFGKFRDSPHFPDRSDFETFGTAAHPVAMRIRHLPTDENVALARDVFGAPGEKLMTAWRALFDALPGVVERLEDGRIKYGSDGKSLVRRLADGNASHLESNSLLNRANWATSQKRVLRTKVQHLLEDAAMAVAMAEASVAPVMLGFVHVERRGMRMSHMMGVKLTNSGCVDIGAESEDILKTLHNSIFPANPYWQLPSFLDHCGRAMRETDGIGHLCATLYDMSLQGHTKAFVRHCKPKYGTWTVDLSAVDSPMAAMQALIAVCGYGFFGMIRGERAAQEQSRYDRYSGHYLVQEFAPFEIEHRFFVVDGRIAASTPSDRKLSVLDARTGPRRLDSRVAVLDVPAEVPGAYDRGETSNREDRAAVAAMARKVRAFLRDAYADSATAEALPRAFVVDAGIGPRGCGLIEMNTFLNAGIYALDYRKVAKALAAQHPAGIGRLDASVAA